MKEEKFTWGSTDVLNLCFVSNQLPVTLINTPGIKEVTVEMTHSDTTRAWVTDMKTLIVCGDRNINPRPGQILPASSHSVEQKDENNISGFTKKDVAKKGDNLYGVKIGNMGPWGITAAKDTPLPNQEKPGITITLDVSNFATIYRNETCSKNIPFVMKGFREISLQTDEKGNETFL